jgi:hypothetical protein
MSLTKYLPVYCDRDSVTYCACHRQGALTSISYAVWKLNKCMSHSQVHILFHTVVSYAEYKRVGARETRELLQLSEQQAENFTKYSIIYSKGY